MKILNPVRIAGLALVIVSITGCLNPKKMNKWVTGHYGETAATPVKKKTDFLLVKSALPDMGSSLSEGTKKTHSVLPLLFYWRFNYDNTCELNPQIPVNNFINTATPYANKMLKTKLQGRRLELTIEKIPTKFIVADKAQVVWLVYAFAWDQISIRPLDDEMQVSYKLFDAADSELKSGTVNASKSGNGVAKFRSIKQGTLQYLTDYNTAISDMTRKIIDQLVFEIQ